MNWIKVKLIDICEPRQWKNLPSIKLLDYGYPVYGANGLIGYYSEYTHEFPTIAITCRGATSGNVHLTKSKSYINSNAMALDNINLEKYDLKYLYYFLQNRGLRDVISGSAQPQITRTNLKRVELDIPKSLTDQKRIAKVLSHCEEFIQKRKQSIELLDEFLKSTFLEMFEEDIRKIDENFILFKDIVPSIDNGWSPKCEAKERDNDNQWAVLKLSSITKQIFEPHHNKLCFDNTEIKKEIVPRNGDLLFSRKNTYELVGATAYVFKDHNKLLLPDTIFRLNYNSKKVSGLFLWFLLNDKFFSRRVRNLASGAAGSMPNISKSKLLGLKIPNIEYSNQIRFASIVEKTEIIKTQYQQSLKELENLYSSLSQKAFKGELDLSGVEVDGRVEGEYEVNPNIDNLIANNLKMQQKFAASPVLKIAMKAASKMSKFLVNPSIIKANETAAKIYELTKSKEIALNRFSEFNKQIKVYEKIVAEIPKIPKEIISLTEAIGKIKLEVEQPKTEPYVVGNATIQDHIVHIDQIIKENFLDSTFSFEQLNDAISNEGVHVTYKEQKEFLFKALEGKDAFLQQIFDEQKKEIRFKVKYETNPAYN